MDLEGAAAPQPRHRWRCGLASRVLAAALSGLADALDRREREAPPDVEEAPEPPAGRWLVLLDREDPSRSLVIVPHQVATATGALERVTAQAVAPAHSAGCAGIGAGDGMGASTGTASHPYGSDPPSGTARSLLGPSPSPGPSSLGEPSASGGSNGRADPSGSSGSTGGGTVRDR